MVNIEKLFDLIDAQPSVLDEPGATQLDVGAGGIEFDSVSFSYNADRRILNNISFSVAPGTKVAVVGASGSGKSTLVKLLFRFYDADSGSIKINNQEIRQQTQHSLRKAVGIVPQDTVLFNDSILENVRYGRPEATDQEVRQAIKMAMLNDLVKRLPEGENTKVGERGLKLSGGEKQRVSIARTILKDSPILVFDEATSSLDTQSEQAILSSMRDLARDHTSLVIAHRLSTIIDADEIVVLHHGDIVERGNHQDLLDRQGAYAALWQAQQKQKEHTNP
jgi:ATP-binding cassette subfamily B protein